MLEREPLGSVKIGPKLLPSLGLALCPASVAHTGLLAPQSLGCLTVLPSPENVGNNQQKFVAQVRAPSTSPVARVAGGEGLAAVGSHTGWWSDPRLYPTAAPRKSTYSKERALGGCKRAALCTPQALQPEPPTSGVPQSPPTGECSPLKLGTRTLPHL